MCAHACRRSAPQLCHVTRAEDRNTARRMWIAVSNCVFVHQSVGVCVCVIFCVRVGLQSAAALTPRADTTSQCRGGAEGHPSHRVCDRVRWHALATLPREAVCAAVLSGLTHTCAGLCGAAGAPLAHRH